MAKCGNKNIEKYLKILFEARMFLRAILSTVKLLPIASRNQVVSLLKTNVVAMNQNTFPEKKNIFI